MEWLRKCRREKLLDHVLTGPEGSEKTTYSFDYKNSHIVVNHIGMSVVKIEKIEYNKLYFSEVDVLDGTPVLDIKPYAKHFDDRNKTVSACVDKHFQSTDMPDKTILK